MYYTYVLQSENNGRLYIGSTADLKKRFSEHNYGKVRSTKTYRPWRLVYYEAHIDLGKAKVAELFYKTGQGRRQIKKKLGL